MPFAFKNVILVSLSSFSSIDRVSNQHRETRLYLIENRLGFRKHFDGSGNFFSFSGTSLWWFFPFLLRIYDHFSLLITRHLYFLLILIT